MNKRTKFASCGDPLWSQVAPRAWFEKFSIAVNWYGLRQYQENQMLFLKTLFTLQGKNFDCIDWVIGDNCEEIKKLMGLLSWEFEINDLFLTLLRCKLQAHRMTFYKSKRKCNLNLLKETWTIGCKTHCNSYRSKS